MNIQGVNKLILWEEMNFCGKPLSLILGEISPHAWDQKLVEIIQSDLIGPKMLKEVMEKPLLSICTFLMENLL